MLLERYFDVHTEECTQDLKGYEYDCKGCKTFQYAIELVLVFIEPVIYYMIVGLTA